MSNEYYSGYYKRYEPIFGSWRIVRMIGEGSFGKVFEIQREDFGTVYKAALKAITIPTGEAEIQEVLAEGMDENSVHSYFGSFVQELVQEFALMSQLKGNSNIVSYEDHIVVPHEDGIGWDILIRMELLTPLNAYLKANPFKREDVIRLGLDMCHALELCEKRNILHRDLKPENIFVSADGYFKLGDFGIARTVEKTTGGLSKKGTYTYIAPEVYKGEPYGKTVDIYSLGIVLYRLMNNNRAPFLPPAPEVITPSAREKALAKRLSGETLPPPRNASPELARIILKACAYHPHDRYASAAQMRRELEALLYERQETPYETVRDPSLTTSVQETEPTEASATVCTFSQQPDPVQELKAESSRSKQRKKPFHTILFTAVIGLLSLAVLWAGIAVGKGKQPNATDDGKTIAAPTAPTESTAAPTESTTALTEEITQPVETVPAVHVMAAAEDLSGEITPQTDRPFWGQTQYKRSDVKTITFQSRMSDVPSDAWDVSEAGDRSVLAWMNGSNLYVAANGSIAPNSNASWMFANFSNLKAIDFGNCLDTSNVKSMYSMFEYCISLSRLDLSGFDTSSVTNMSWMFANCEQLTQLDLSGFDTSRVIKMEDMFYSCFSLTSLDVSGFDTANVTDMSGMFSWCSGLTSLELSGFDVSNVTDMRDMFTGSGNLTNLKCSDKKILAEYEKVFPPVHVMVAAEDLSGIDYEARSDQPFWGQTRYKRSEVKTVTFQSHLDGVPDDAWDVSEAKDRSVLAWMDSGNLHVAANGKIAPNSNASWMFAYFENLERIDFENCLDTASVTDMSGMFACCGSLTSLYLSTFDTSNVADMNGMFCECSSLTSLDLSDFDTSKVTDMSWMFSGCSLISLDLSGFDTAEDTSMYQMFAGCSRLSNLQCSDGEILAEYHKGVVAKEAISQGLIATGGPNVAVLHEDGTVSAFGRNEDGQCNTASWTDIIAVSSSCFHTVGLKSDGTVVAVGLNGNHQCDVSDWTDIVQIAAGAWHTVGLKSDGTVVAAGNKDGSQWDEGQCNVESWTDIVQVVAGDYYTIGIKSDGTFVDTGILSCEEWVYGINQWTDIVAAACNCNRVVGLKSNGTVVPGGNALFSDCDYSDWTDIVAVAAGYYHTVGLRSDGTVVAAGINQENAEEFGCVYYGQCDVDDWTDIVAIAAGINTTVGLKKDGTFLVIGEYAEDLNRQYNEIARLQQ